jgi:hypothetical protein
MRAGAAKGAKKHTRQKVKTELLNATMFAFPPEKMRSLQENKGKKSFGVSSHATRPTSPENAVDFNQ